jgi:hypothetical protein
MKILKYIIFVSILSSLFFLVYRQSDKTGFRRWWMSFKMSAFIAAILAGLIPSNVEAIELDVPNNSPSIETVFSNQEFNSLGEDSQQVILAKADGGVLPGAEGFTPIQKPVQNHNGLFGTKKMVALKNQSITITQVTILVMILVILFFQILRLIQI